MRTIISRWDRNLRLNGHDSDEQDRDGETNRHGRERGEVKQGGVPRRRPLFRRPDPDHSSVFCTSHIPRSKTPTMSQGFENIFAVTFEFFDFNLFREI